MNICIDTITISMIIGRGTKMHMCVWGSCGTWGHAHDTSAGGTHSASNTTGRVRSGSLRPARNKKACQGSVKTAAKSYKYRVCLDPTGL